MPTPRSANIKLVLLGFAVIIVVATLLYTRYLVEVDGCGDLVVVEQNLKSTSMDVLKAKGKKARLFWNKEHITRVGG